MLGHVLTDATDRAGSGSMATVVGLRAVAPGLDALTVVERQLLTEWLDRVVDDGAGSSAGGGQSA